MNGYYSLKLQNKLLNTEAGLLYKQAANAQPHHGSLAKILKWNVDKLNVNK